MWAVALIVIVEGIIRVTPGDVRLYNEVDCHRFGELWEAEYVRMWRADPGKVDHMCTEIEIPGVDI